MRTGPHPPQHPAPTTESLHSRHTAGKSHRSGHKAWRATSFTLFFLVPQLSWRRKQTISGNSRLTNRIVKPVFLDGHHRNKSLSVVSWMCTQLSTGNSTAMHAINSVPATYFIQQGPAPGASFLQAGTYSLIPTSIKQWIEQQFAFCGTALS